MLDSPPALENPLDGIFLSYTPPPKLKVSEWADRYRYLSPESSAEPGKWHTSRTPYLRDIMDAVNEPDVEVIVVMSSSQVGKTEVLLNVAGYHIHQDPCPMLLIEPTVNIAEAYSKDRLSAMIRDTPVLSDLIREPRAKDGSNTVLHKKFPGGQLTLGGANSPSGLASRPIRILKCDEVDRYPLSAGSEGDPLSLADKRTTTFWNRKKIYVSSPTIKNISRIEAAFEASDRRYYHVPCPSCNKFQKLEWEYVRWDEGKPETAAYTCRFCSAAWTDAERYDAVMKGKWIPEGEFNGTAGFHIWEAYSPWSRLASMVDQFLKAKHAKDRGDNEPYKAWKNTVLGQTFEEDAESRQPEPLLARRESYGPGQIPWPILYLTAGVDVQDDRLEIEIVGWRAESRQDPPESWGIEDLVLYRSKDESSKFKVQSSKSDKPETPNSKPGTRSSERPTAVWDELDEILKREYASQDGRRLRISAACIDSGGHHTNEVYTFCNTRIGRHVYAIKGADGSRPIWPRRAGKSKKFKGSLVWLCGVDTAKDAIYSALKVETPGAGYAHFPVSYELEYFQQLTAEQVKTKFKNGRPYRFWFKPLGVRNEALDRRVYALAELHSRPVPWEILARSGPKEPPPDPEEVQKFKGSNVQGPPQPQLKEPAPGPQPPSPQGGRRVRFKFGR
jgi:phage terminase large subunit GpA-like protein